MRNKTLGEAINGFDSLIYLINELGNPLLVKYHKLNALSHLCLGIERDPNKLPSLLVNFYESDCLEGNHPIAKKTTTRSMIFFKKSTYEPTSEGSSVYIQAKALVTKVGAELRVLMHNTTSMEDLIKSVSDIVNPHFKNFADFFLTMICLEERTFGKFRSYASICMMLNDNLNRSYILANGRSYTTDHIHINHGNTPESLFVYYYVFRNWANGMHTVPECIVRDMLGIYNPPIQKPSVVSSYLAERKEQIIQITSGSNTKKTPKKRTSRASRSSVSSASDDDYLTNLSINSAISSIDVGYISSSYDSGSCDSSFDSGSCDCSCGD